MDDRAQMLHTLLEIGEGMLAVGADVHQVERTIALMGKAYGAVRMDVLVITTSIVVTICYADGTADTQTRRISKNSATDFSKLEQFNAISREYCQTPFETEQLLDRILQVKAPSIPKWQIFLGSLLAAFGFAVFFGGSMSDGLVSAAFSLMVCLLQFYTPRICKNRVVFHFLVSFITGACISGFCRYFPTLHPDQIIIGDIMLLIPGLAFTNAVKDVFMGDTISGLMRFVETVLWAAAIAIGFVLAARLMGGLV